MNSPLNILSPSASGFFILGGAAAAFGISFGGSMVAILVERLRVVFDANEFAFEDNEGERLVLSRSASDQLKPSPAIAVSFVDRSLKESSASV